MKLRNKKTGEVVIVIDHLFDNYNSITELCEEWEDYKEPKKSYWYIDGDGETYQMGGIANITKSQMVNIGNYFETKEEAEKAVEKLKAWKRLKEQGFRFKTYQRSPQGTYDIYANWEGYMPPLSWVIDKDLDLLFGGEE